MSDNLQLSRKIHFSCGHRYFVESWSDEKNKEVFGKSYSPEGHGHNFILEASFSGEMNPQTGLIVDLREIDKTLKSVTDELDHKFLNTDVDHFKSHVPTTENILLFLKTKILNQIDNDYVTLTSLKLFETESLWVEWNHEQ